MKNNIKRMMPYIIINGIIFSILGAIIGKNIIEIHNTSKRIDNDSRSLDKWAKELGSTQIETHKISEDEVPQYIKDKVL